jgi:hypothetical protein
MKYESPNITLLSAAGQGDSLQEQQQLLQQSLQFAAGMKTLSKTSSSSSFASRSPDAIM